MQAPCEMRGVAFVETLFIQTTLFYVKFLNVRPEPVLAINVWFRNRKKK
eukprot:COSAG06_NODE_6665_length_2835_cov_2.151681_4_plen_49_part_00